MIVGRGSFTESFPLFGYDMANYEALFEEKLNLFAELLKGDAGHMERQAAFVAVEPDRVSADREGHAADMGRRWRQPGVSRARGPLRVCH